jgi:hypothetical protein
MGRSEGVRVRSRKLRSRLRYGPRGNLRDSQGDAIQFDNGRELMRMDNWCVIFDVPL